MLKAIIATNRECYAGWAVGPDGTAYDFQGRCIPGGGGAAGQFSDRMCLNPYFTHGQTYYDSKGYCDPTKTPIPGYNPIAADNYSQIWTWAGYAAIGFGGYWLWKNRKWVF